MPLGMKNCTTGIGGWGVAFSQGTNNTRDIEAGSGWEGVALRASTVPPAKRSRGLV